MKTKLSNKVGAVITAVITLIISINLASCVSKQYVPVNTGSGQNRGYYTPQGGAPIAMNGCGIQQPYPSINTGSYGGQRRCAAGTSAGPVVPPNMPGRQQSDWKLGPVLHERWYYDPTTGKTTKVGEETLQPGPQLDAKMRTDGLTPFPNRVPIGGELPSEGAVRGKKHSGSAPSIENMKVTPLPPPRKESLESS